MPTRAALFVHAHFTNPDRKPDHQLAIHERGLWLLARLQRCPFRVRELEPFVLGLTYLFFDTFRSTGKNRHEIVYVCSAALRVARHSRRHPLTQAAAEEWIDHVLESLIKKEELRQSGNRLVSTGVGDARIAALESARPFRDPHADRLVLIPPKRPRTRTGRTPEWLPMALNLLKDNLPQYEIARRVGVAQSTLSANPQWLEAKKVLAIPAPRRRRFRH